MSDKSGDGVRMGLVPVPDGQGGIRHEFRPLPPAKGKKKTRIQPADIHANPDESAQRLKIIIERKERLLEERQGINDDLRDVASEAKAIGFDNKTIDAIIRLRKMNPDLRMEAEMLLDAYKSALGME